MKQLPLEECGPSHKHQKAKPRNRSEALKRSLPGSSQLVKLQLSLKDYTRLLKRYADGKVPDKDVLDLLDGTRTKVIDLYITRKKLEEKSIKQKKQAPKKKIPTTHKHRRRK